MIQVKWLDETSYYRIGMMYSLDNLLGVTVFKLTCNYEVVLFTTFLSCPLTSDSEILYTPSHIMDSDFLFLRNTWEEISVNPTLSHSNTKK